MLRTLLLAAVMALGLLLPDTAAAHAVLVDSLPAPKAKVVGSKVEFNLHYNSRVDAKRSRLTLKGPAGARALEVRQGKTEADLAADIVTLAPGGYVLHWDVLSVDGHVSRGQVPFTATER
ncbi:MAG: copper resistance protein CopC [Phaeospirillum sp.]|nr:copper resistance protein CopC [Phaeospirillum sp.]